MEAAAAGTESTGSSTSSRSKSTGAERGGERHGAAARGRKREVMVRTTSSSVLTSALECGLGDARFVFDGDAEGRARAEAFGQLAGFEAVFEVPGGGGVLESAEGGKVALVVGVADAEGGRRAAALVASGREACVVLDAAEWPVILAENVVAAAEEARRQWRGGAGEHATRVMALVRCAAEAEVSLGALDVGVDGVVVETEDAGEVRKVGKLIAGLEGRRVEDEGRALVRGRVTAVRPAGMGDRVCVDLTSLIAPGWGMPTGSFAQALLLVHSECAESGYVASRPFRVNAGAVCSYSAAPGGQTRYLSELRAGAEVLVCHGRTGEVRTVTVGRVKIEHRPMVMVEVEVLPGQGEFEEGPKGERVTAAALVQNAETVRILTPPEAGGQAGAVSVSNLCVGDTVLVALDTGGGGRHTGLVVEDMNVIEK